MAVQDHPFNRAFHWPDRPTTGLRRLTAQQVAQYNEQGFCLLTGAAPPNTVAELIAAIDPIEAQVGDYTIVLEDRTAYTYQADAMTFANDLVLASPRVRAFCASPLFQDVTHDLLGDDVRLYWNQAVYKKPDKGRTFPWHQDNGYTYCEPQAYLTCWLALTDATVDNGCPWVIPGLHRRGTLVHEDGDWGLRIRGIDTADADRAVAVPAAAGDMVIFSSLTPHKTGANVTDGIRKALILQYAADGACRIDTDGRTIPQDDAERNLPILRGGAPVAAR